MEQGLWQQGVDLMLYGMGTVFVFLLLLVFVTTFMSRIITGFFPEAEPAPATSSKAPASKGQLPSEKTLAIIKDAIAQHRKRKDRD